MPLRPSLAKAGLLLEVLLQTLKLFVFKLIVGLEDILQRDLSIGIPKMNLFNF